MLKGGVVNIKRVNWGSSGVRRNYFLFNNNAAQFSRSSLLTCFKE